VFWPLQLSSKVAGVPKDSKFPLLGMWISSSHLPQSGVATPFSLIGHHYHINIVMELHNIFSFFLTFFFLLPTYSLFLFIRSVQITLFITVFIVFAQNKSFQVPFFFLLCLQEVRATMNAPRFIVYKRHLGQSSNLITIFFLCVRSGFRHPNVVNLLIVSVKGKGWSSNCCHYLLHVCKRQGEVMCTPSIIILLVTFARSGGNLGPSSSSSCVLKVKELGAPIVVIIFFCVKNKGTQAFSFFLLFE